jgi:predicted RNase H-like HicB family nuclease
MLDLPYSLVIEATSEPNFFGFYSPELEGFSGVGHSVEDCLYQAKWGMNEHVQVLIEQNLPVPQVNLNPTVTIQNEPPARSRRRSKVGQRKASPKAKSKVGKR